LASVVHIDESRGASGSGTLASVNAYVYTGSAEMYGPKFTTTTQGVYKAADKATANTIVP
jgi:hypothetical protein